MVVSIVAPICVALVFFFIGYYYFIRKKKTRGATPQQETGNKNIDLILCYSVCMFSF